MKRWMIAVGMLLLMATTGCTARQAPSPSPDAAPAPAPLLPTRTPPTDTAIPPAPVLPVLPEAPVAADIAWVEVGLGLPTPPDQQPQSLFTDTDQGRAVTAKLLGWLNAAQPAAGEISPPARTPTLVFRLRNGDGASVQAAYDCTYTKTDSGNGMRCGQAPGQVIFYPAGGASPMRLRSPDLAYWVLQAWRKDLALGLKQCGAEEVRHGDGIDSAARDCIWAAYQGAVPARFITTALTEEGDPITVDLYTRADGKVTAVRDTRADKFGEQKVTTYTCSVMEKRQSFHLSGCTGGDADQIDI